MNVKTKDLIKILPFEESFRKNLLAKFDALPYGKKYEVIDLLWKSFDSWYSLKLDENIQLALSEGTESLDKDFYKRVKEKTDREIEEGAVKSVETADLEEARRAMEFIVKEIKSSKVKTN